MADIPDLSEDEWLKLLKRLAIYADRKLSRLYWRGVRGSQGGMPPKGVDAEDIAQEAITDLISGKRAWDKERQPDLQKQLEGVVDSQISNLAMLLENKRTVGLDDRPKGEKNAATYVPPSREPNPADLVAVKWTPKSRPPNPIS